MSTKFLLITAFVFFLAWRTAKDSFLLFCTLFAAGLFICVLIYRSETTHRTIDKEN
jgi:Flp pilus assembly protein protease CpaA